MTLSISEIVYKAASITDKAEQVEFLRKNSSETLRMLLALMYNKNYVWEIPNTTPPPYRPSGYPDAQGMLYRRARILKYMIKGFGGENLTQQRKEQLFIELLESIDKDDALYMIQVLMQKPIEGLNVPEINLALNMEIQDSANQPTSVEEVKPLRKKPGRKPKNVQEA